MSKWATVVCTEAGRKSLTVGMVWGWSTWSPWQHGLNTQIQEPHSLNRKNLCIHNEGGALVPVVAAAVAAVGLASAGLWRCHHRSLSWSHTLTFWLSCSAFYRVLLLAIDRRPNEICNTWPHRSATQRNAAHRHNRFMHLVHLYILPVPWIPSRCF